MTKFFAKYLSVMLLLAVFSQSTGWADSELYLDTSKLLKINPHELAREREFIVDKWAVKKYELKKQMEDLPGIRRIIASAILARINKPNSFTEFDKEIREALYTWANPERFTKDQGTGKLFDPAAKLSLNPSRFAITVRRQAFTLPSEIRRNYMNAMLINYTQDTWLQILECALCGAPFSPNDPGLSTRANEFGDLFRWKAWEIYLEQLIRDEDQRIQAQKFLVEFCTETNAMDSPVFCFFVTDYAISQKLSSLAVLISSNISVLEEGIAFRKDGNQEIYRPKSKMEEISVFLSEAQKQFAPSLQPTKQPEKAESEIEDKTAILSPESATSQKPAPKKMPSSKKMPALFWIAIAAFTGWLIIIVRSRKNG